MISTTQDILDELKKADIPSTRQRMEILRELTRRSDHPDAESLLKSVRDELPSVSSDTVYRTLNRFAGAGIIMKMAAPTRRARYDGNIRPHDHFICSVCERILDVFSVQQPASDISVHNDMIAEVWSEQRMYTGICRPCHDARERVTVKK